MTAHRSAQAIRQDLAETEEEPEGRARNARAERLLAEAELTGDRTLVIDALLTLVKAYEYSSEGDRTFVPFARLLRMWDENPADFDEWRTHNVYWMFKWVSSGMIDQPHIPLDAIEKWLAEMARRYRIAGHSERAVRQGEWRVAWHIGDLERAQRAYDAWLAADRDRLSDCHACELHGQARWQVHLGDDRAALEIWRPVLEGELHCAHQPHVALSASLLPLVRLGHLDQARAHHLRGYRLARSVESLRSAVAGHVEFCALTGNEPRGLEILANHADHFTATGDPDSLLDHLSVTTLLTDRLVALGHGDRPVPGPPGQEWTAADLAAHTRAEALRLAAEFDKRNGTSAVSDRITARMSRPPLLDRLPLGVRSALAGPAPARAAAPAAPAPAAEPEELGALVERARRLTRDLHPDALPAWARVGAAAERAGTELDARTRGEVADHAGLAVSGEDPATAAGHFRDAAREFAAAGDEGEATAARARAAFAELRAGEEDDADFAAKGVAAVEEATAGLRALHAAGRATTRQLTGALNLRVRARLGTLRHAADPRAEFAALERDAREIADLAERHRAEDRMPSRSGDASCLLGELAERRGAPGEAAAHYTAAGAAYRAAGLPWAAVEADAWLAGAALDADDPETAERAARAALEAEGEPLSPPLTAHLHAVLAEALVAARNDEEAARIALESAHWADAAGVGATVGAWARLVLGGAYQRLGRPAEGAAVLETALPDLITHHHEGRVVQARWWLGDCLTALEEHREAAAEYLRAAEIAQGWPEQRDHAVLAVLAAEALSRAGQFEDSLRASERAEQLWRALGNPVNLVRTLRARGWVALVAAEGREKPAMPGAARAAMEAALQEVRAALAATEGAGDASGAARLRFELAATHRQFAEIMLRATGVREIPPDGPVRAAYQEGLGHVEQAAAALAAIGPQARDDLTAVELWAAWLDADLDNPSRAADRARRVLAAHQDDEREVAAERRATAESVLEYVARRAADEAAAAPGGDPEEKGTPAGA
jgi:hypothetical protein